MCVSVLTIVSWGLGVLTIGYLIGRWRARTDFAAILKEMIDMTRKEESDEPKTCREKD